MWRDSGVVLLLASATFMIVCAQEDYNRNVTLTVPRWVQNGTEEQVILDCEYDYDLDEEKFTVKWFLNTNREAIYQWIPTMNSRMFSSLFGSYADWEYQLEDNDKFTKYRRIVLVRPTIEFSGVYACWVASMSRIGNAEATMDIYAPAKNVTITYNTLPDELVNVTCFVEKVYPKPDVQLLTISTDDLEPWPIGKTTSLIKDNGIHGYDIVLNAVLKTYKLNGSSDTKFICEVIIHDGVHKQFAETIYHPKSEMAVLEPLYENHNKPSSSPRLVSASLICIIFAILLL